MIIHLAVEQLIQIIVDEGDAGSRDGRLSQV